MKFTWFSHPHPAHMYPHVTQHYAVYTVLSSISITALNKVIKVNMELEEEMAVYIFRCESPVPDRGQSGLLRSYSFLMVDFYSLGRILVELINNDQML